jgi:hypothetical protein
MSNFDDGPLEPPITDQELGDLQERNAQRAKEAIAKLGNLYLCYAPQPRLMRPPADNILRGTLRAQP